MLIFCGKSFVLERDPSGEKEEKHFVQQRTTKDYGWGSNSQTAAVFLCVDMCVHSINSSINDKM